MGILEILTSNEIARDNGIDVNGLLEKKRIEAEEKRKAEILEKQRETSRKIKNKYVKSQEASGKKSCNIFILESLLPYVDEEVEQSGGKLNRSDIINKLLTEKYKNNNI